MGRFIDVTGQVFGELKVLRRSEGPHESDYAYWVCRCSCGKEVTVRGTNLRYGKPTSCGCLQRKSVTRHGMHKTPEYKVWNSMIQRCCNPNAQAYKNYGGRGITVCERWRHEFMNFYEDMGKRPSDKHSLDRIDNAGNYEPGNCRWATSVEQNRNTRGCKSLVFHGVTMTVIDAAEAAGVSYNKLLRAYHRSMDEATEILESAGFNLPELKEVKQ